VKLPAPDVPRARLRPAALHGAPSSAYSSVPAIAIVRGVPLSNFTPPAEKSLSELSAASSTQDGTWSESDMRGKEARGTGRLWADLMGSVVAAACSTCEDDDLRLLGLSG